MLRGAGRRRIRASPRHHGGVRPLCRSRRPQPCPGHGLPPHVFLCSLPSVLPFPFCALCLRSCFFWSILLSALHCCDHFVLVEAQGLSHVQLTTCPFDCSFARLLFVPFARFAGLLLYFIIFCPLLPVCATFLLLSSFSPQLLFPFFPHAFLVTFDSLGNPFLPHIRCQSVIGLTFGAGSQIAERIKTDGINILIDLTGSITPHPFPTYFTPNNHASPLPLPTATALQAS